MAPMVSDILVNTDSSTGTMLVSGHNLNQSYLSFSRKMSLSAFIFLITDLPPVRCRRR